MKVYIHLCIFEIMGEKLNKLIDVLDQIESLKQESIEAIENGGDIEIEWNNTGLVQKPKCLTDRMPADFHFNGSQSFTFRIKPYK